MEKISVPDFKMKAIFNFFFAWGDGGISPTLPPRMEFS